MVILVYPPPCTIPSCCIRCATACLFCSPAITLECATRAPVQRSIGRERLSAAGERPSCGTRACSTTLWACPVRRVHGGFPQVQGALTMGVLQGWYFSHSDMDVEIVLT